MGVTGKSTKGTTAKTIPQPGSEHKTRLERQLAEAPVRAPSCGWVGCAYPRTAIVRPGYRFKSQVRNANAASSVAKERLEYPQVTVTLVILE